MVSEPTTSPSADACVDRAMDPFDRCILLCEKILARLSGRVVQPENSDAHQELATGCVNTTGSSDRAVPAKCSTFGLVPDASVVPAIEVPLVVEVVTPTSPILAKALAFPFVRQLSVLKPDKRMPTTCSTEVLEHEVDATQLYIKGVLASAASGPQVHAELLIADTGNRIQVGNVMPFDPGTKLQSSFQALVAIPLARVEVCVLPSGGENHDKLNLDTMCNISPTADNQWFRKTSSGDILINCQQYNMLLVDALGRIVTWEVDVNWLYKGRSIINIIDINLTMPWDPGGIRCAEFFSLHSLLPMLIHHAPSSTKNLLPDLSEVDATYENLLPRSFRDCEFGSKLIHVTCTVHAIEICPAHITDDFVSGELNTIKLRMPNMNINVAPSIKFFSLWSMVALCCAHNGSLVRLSISVTTPWDPGDFNFQPAQAFRASRQLTILWLWDPGGYTWTLGLGVYWILPCIGRNNYCKLYVPYPTALAITSVGLVTVLKSINYVVQYLMIWDPGISECVMEVPYYLGNTIGVYPSACREIAVQQYMDSDDLNPLALHTTHHCATSTSMQLENLIGGSHQTAEEVGLAATKYFCFLDVCMKPEVEINGVTIIGVELHVYSSCVWLSFLALHTWSWYYCRTLQPRYEFGEFSKILIDRVPITGSYWAMIDGCLQYAEHMKPNASFCGLIVADHYKLTRWLQFAIQQVFSEVAVNQITRVCIKFCRGLYINRHRTGLFHGTLAVILHRLGGKPNFKRGSMSHTGSMPHIRSSPGRQPI